MPEVPTLPTNATPAPKEILFSDIPDESPQALPAMPQKAPMPQYLTAEWNRHIDPDTPETPDVLATRQAYPLQFNQNIERKYPVPSVSDPDFYQKLNPPVSAVIPAEDTNSRRQALEQRKWWEDRQNAPQMSAATGNEPHLPYTPDEPPVPVVGAGDTQLSRTLNRGAANVLGAPRNVMEFAAGQARRSLTNILPDQVLKPLDVTEQRLSAHRAEEQRNIALNYPNRGEVLSTVGDMLSTAGKFAAASVVPGGVPAVAASDSAIATKDRVYNTLINSGMSEQEAKGKAEQAALLSGLAGAATAQVYGGIPVKGLNTLTQYANTGLGFTAGTESQKLFDELVHSVYTGQKADLSVVPSDILKDFATGVAFHGMTHLSATATQYFQGKARQELRNRGESIAEDPKAKAEAKQLADEQFVQQTLIDQHNELTKQDFLEQEGQSRIEGAAKEAIGQQIPTPEAQPNPYANNSTVPIPTGTPEPTSEELRWKAAKARELRERAEQQPAAATEAQPAAPVVNNELTQGDNHAVQEQGADAQGVRNQGIRREDQPAAVGEGNAQPQETSGAGQEESQVHQETPAPAPAESASELADRLPEPQQPKPQHNPNDLAAMFREMAAKIEQMQAKPAEQPATAREPWQMTRDKALWGEYSPEGAGTDRALKGRLASWEKIKKAASAENVDTPEVDRAIAAEKARIARANEHRAAVEQALKEGKDVPANVLRDYLDLVEKYGKQETVSREYLSLAEKYGKQLEGKPAETKEPPQSAAVQAKEETEQPVHEMTADEWAKKNLSPNLYKLATTDKGENQRALMQPFADAALQAMREGKPVSQSAYNSLLRNGVPSKDESVLSRYRWEDGMYRSIEKPTTPPPEKPATPSEPAKPIKVSGSKIGDFIEFKGNDADVVSKITGVTLTTRDNGKVKLAGFPAANVSKYAKKLKSAGIDLDLGIQEEAKRALQISKATSILPRQQGETESRGSKRGRVGRGVEGTETTGAVAQTEEGQKAPVAGNVADNLAEIDRQISQYSRIKHKSTGEILPSAQVKIDQLTARKRSIVEGMVQRGEPVTRTMLSNFKGEKWADDAVAKLPVRKPTAEDALSKRRGELENQLRDMVAREIGPDAIKHLAEPKKMEIMRGDASPGIGVPLDEAKEYVSQLPDDHPAQLVLHNLKELEKNPRGTKIQKVNTNDVQDGTRVQVNDGETMTIDKENMMVEDGVTAPIPPGGLTLYGKKILPPHEGPKELGEFNPEEQTNFVPGNITEKYTPYIPDQLRSIDRQGPYTQALQKRQARGDESAHQEAMLILDSLNGKQIRELIERAGLDDGDYKKESTASILDRIDAAERKAPGSVLQFLNTEKSEPVAKVGLKPTATAGGKSDMFGNPMFDAKVGETEQFSFGQESDAAAREKAKTYSPEIERKPMSPVSEPVEASANAVKPENTGEMFGEEKGQILGHGASPKRTKDMESLRKNGADIPEGRTRSPFIDDSSFVEKDVKPTVSAAIRAMHDVGKWFRQTFAPQTASDTARQTADRLRQAFAEQARAVEVVKKNMANAHWYFDGRPTAENMDFIDRYETGKPQATRALDHVADYMRKASRDQTDRIDRLGDGMERIWRENYIRHLWKEPQEKVESVISKILAKRPMEGSKGFLKQRTYETYRDGIEAGLTPLFDNPVDSFLHGYSEAEKFIKMREAANQFKAPGNGGVFVRAGDKAPDGTKIVDDPAFHVYGPPTITVNEFVNKSVWEALNAVGRNLGLDIKTKMTLPEAPQAGGYMKWGTPETVRRFGTDLGVLAHEISHQLHQRYPELNQFLKPEYAEEMRALADLHGYKKDYFRKSKEKMASILEAYVAAPESFRLNAPSVYKEFTSWMEQHPEVYPILELERGLGLQKLSSEINVPGIRKMGSWAIPEDAANVITNHLTPGLRSNPLFRGWMWVGNKLNSIQLAGAFHAGFTSFDAYISRQSLALEQLANGKPIAAVKSLLSSPVAPITNAMHGSKLIHEYLNPGSNPELTPIVDALVSGGARRHMDDALRTKTIPNMVKAFRQNNMMGGIARVPGSAIDVVSYPIMERLVPMQKWGVMGDLMREELGKLGDKATPKQISESARKVVDSVDNRLGQISYDNLFLNRKAKDALMAMMRSVGWNIGTVRELGGSIVDIPKDVSSLAKRQGFQGHRLPYTLALLSGTAMVGALYQYLKTGQYPQELKDYYFPKTGRKDENGDDIRVQMPSYMRDIAHLAHNGIGQVPSNLMDMAANKSSPQLSLLMDMIRNHDYYGTQITPPRAELATKVKDRALYVVKQAVPFTVQGWKNQGENVPMNERISNTIGVTPAPKRFTQSPAEEFASGIMREKGEFIKTPEKAEKAQLKRDLVRSIKEGNKDAALQAYKDKKIDHYDYNDIIQRAKLTPLQSIVKHMNVEDALSVYMHPKITDQEKQEINRMVRDKINNAHLNDKQKKELRRKAGFVSTANSKPANNGSNSR